MIGPEYCGPDQRHCWQVSPSPFIANKKGTETKIINQLLMCPPTSFWTFHLPRMNDIESSGNI